MNSSKNKKAPQKDNKKVDQKSYKKTRKLSPEEEKIQSQIDKNNQELTTLSNSILDSKKNLYSLDAKNKKFLEFMAENAKVLEQRQTELNNLKTSSADSSFAENKRKAEETVNKLKARITDLVGDIGKCDELALYDKFQTQIERLDERVESGMLNSREEKIVISKISALKNNQTLIIEYSDACKELGKYKVDQSAKFQRKDEFNRSHLISVIDFLMEKQRKLYERLQQNSDEFSKVAASIKETQNKMTGIVQNNNELKNKLVDLRENEYNRKKEEEKKREEEFNERVKKLAAESSQTKKPFDEEISVCDELIAYIQKLAPKEQKLEESAKSKKKGIRILPLSHSSDIYKKFQQIDIVCPLLPTDVASTLNELEAKKLIYQQKAEEAAKAIENNKATNQEPAAEN